MSKTQFSEVDSTTFDTNSIVEGNIRDNQVIDKSELGIEDKGSEPGDAHVYIAFQKEVSIDDGISTIQQQVLQGQTLDVKRRDDAGNAVVAVISNQDIKAIEALDCTSFVKIDKGANITQSQEQAVEEKQNDSTQTTEAASNDDSEAADEALEDDESTTDVEQEQNQPDADQQETIDTHTETQQTNIDTNTKKNGSPLIFMGVLIIAVVVAVLIIRKNR